MKAKKRELNRLEISYERAHGQLMECLERSVELSDEDGPTQLAELKILSEKLAIIQGQILQIESIPALPIRWSSMARVSFSALFSMGSPMVNDWLTKLMRMS